MKVMIAWPRAWAMAVAGSLLLAACDDSGQSNTGNAFNAPPPVVGYAIGGTVSGLVGSGLLLQLNGANNTNVVLNGTFQFGATLATNAGYSVTIATQPSFPTQTCQVSNGTGTATTNVTNVTIVCAPAAPAGITIGGTVSGLLTGSSLVLQDNGGDNLAVANNGAFTFATTVLPGQPYTVTVSTQPGSPTQNCRVTLGSGTAGTSNITNVAVVCRRQGQFGYVANNGSNDVSGFKIDPTSGTLTPIPGNPVSVGAAPAIVTLTPDGKFAYVAADNATTVFAFTVDQTSGALTPVTGSPFATPFVNGQPFPGLSVDPTSKFLYIASKGDAQVAGFAINATTGALTPVPGSPFPAGTESSGLPAFSPNGAFLYVTNQSQFNGSVSGYAIDPSTGSLTPVPGSPVAADGEPTWISFTPNGKFAYVANSFSNDVGAYAVDLATGGLTPIGNPYFDGGQAPGDLTIDASGAHLYVPDQASNQISEYAINQTDGTLTLVPGSPFAAGAGPYLVNIEPTGRFAYVSSGNGSGLYAYSIDAVSGALTQLPGSPYVTGNFASVSIDPSGQFAYVANSQDNNITGFSIDALTGVLSPIVGGPFATGSDPFVLSISPEAPGTRD